MPGHGRGLCTVNGRRRDGNRIGSGREGGEGKVRDAKEIKTVDKKTSVGFATLLPCLAFFHAWIGVWLLPYKARFFLFFETCRRRMGSLSQN